MLPDSAPRRLDVQAFAQAGRSLRGEQPVADFERVVPSCVQGAADPGVHWEARGELREAVGGAPEVWMHLQARTALPLTCQRCLDTVHTPLEVDRWFRFVADEATATAQDEICDEDILVLAPDLDLHALIEDELLLELPYVPRHDECPTQGPTAVADAGYVEPATRPGPFAALARLKQGGGKAAG